MLTIWMCGGAYAQRLGGLQGRVIDPSGAVMPGASVVVEPQPSGLARTVQSDGEGHYRVTGLTAGRYQVTAEAEGFQRAVKQVAISGTGRFVTLDIDLSIAAQAQQVVVQGNAPLLDVSPQSNASAVAVSGNNMNALSNDPDELQNQITTLAGPSVGASGAEIYVNGMTGSDMPPKSAIREIRVNSNPFTAENDRLGYGRIDIFTKPGAAAFHGDASSEYNDSVMNAVSTFLSASNVPPPSYHTWLWDADLSGPLWKNASFFFDFQRRNINRASLVNTDILDSSLNVVPYVTSVLNPRILTNVSPHVDIQLSANNTLSASYRYYAISDRNDGIDTQSLPSQAYDRTFHHQNVQIIDTQVLSPRLINQTFFQYLHFHNTQTPQDFSPTIQVLGAFTGGGDSSGTFNRSETHYTIQNYSTLTFRKHQIEFGGTLLDLPRSESTNGGFNGTFTFNSLTDYQKTLQGLQNGMTMAQIQAAGYGPSQFSITGGNLRASINRIDGDLFVNDDWSVTPHLMASYGLRFESENYVSRKFNWAPRIGVSWGLGRSSNTKTVLRAGWGIFYTHLDDDHMIIAQRMNGINQRTYLVNNPDFYPTPPPLSELTGAATSVPTTFQIAPNLVFPYDMDTAVSVERQLSGSTTASLTYVNSRGVHQFLANDINAPLPGTFNPADPTSGVRPLGNAAGNIYNYESTAIYKQTQLVANIHVQTSRVSLFGYYVFNNAHGEAGLNLQSSPAGEFSFQTNPYDLSQDYGRTSFDIRHRVVIGGSFVAPYAFRLSPMLIASSGQPFSIQLPQDIYGTGVYDARPAPATASTPPANVVVTKYGSFNTAPGPNDTPIRPNTETGPNNFMLNVRLSRTFGLGPKVGEKHGGEGSAPETEGGPDHGLGGRGLSSGGGTSLGGATNRRYALTLGVSVLNALNNVNLATPVNVLGSPLFGQSIALATGVYSAQVGNPVANRLVDVGVALSF
ncbi:TonB-dependent receptor [Acidipila rosea]|uniref:TonB-dependent receptor n=1 Tax=Acidipila rosea TaxID=768535 RepID=UPI0014047365|nr:carboxypeptidase-like regulatory domain-containing protein [Acidipila rosea]